MIAAMKEATTDFIATKIADGSGIMGPCTQTAMTPGTQPTASPLEYSAGLDALYCVFGNALCVDTDDVAIHLLVQAFIDRIYANGY